MEMMPGQMLHNLIRRSKTSNGITKEFKQLKTVVHEQFQIHVDVIEQMKESVNEMVDERNINQTEMTQIKFEVDELKEMWKQEIAHHTRNPEEFNINEFKKEEIQDEELDEDNYETESELQTEEKPEVETQDENLRFNWYKKSIHAIPDKYKLQYVQANQNRRNQETIFEWYKECEKIGLIPDEFQLIPEDT